MKFCAYCGAKLEDDALFCHICGEKCIEFFDEGEPEPSEEELKYAEECVSKIDTGKSVYEKLKYIADAHNTINNTIKFSTGKSSDAGADDLSPIFQYIIIKARPKRFFSNINYIKCFLGPNQVKGINGFLLGQMEFAAEFIMRIDCNKVKLNQEEFDNNIKNSIIFKK